MSVLIAAGTGAVSASNATQFEIANDHPGTISATVLAGSEEVDVTYSGDGGTTFQVADSAAGAPLVLTVAIRQLLITNPGIYRVAKDATVGSCAVNLIK